MKTVRSITGRASRSRKTRTTSDAVVILEKMFEGDPGMRRMVEEATINALVAKLIYEARNDAGLTQKQLAELVGTRQPVIARLEDSEYEGHSLTMLQRIASALGKRLDIRMTGAARATPSPRVRKAG